MRHFAPLIAALLLSSPATAANLPLNALTPRGAPVSTDLFPVLPAGATTLQSTTFAQIQSAIAGSLSAVTSLTCGAGLTGGTITSTGTCALATPGPTSLGGVESYAAVSHQFINAISTAGAPSSAQPACADLSNAAASCSTDTTNAANIASGTLPAARLPNPSAGALGGIESFAAVTHQFIVSISTAGVPASAQGACAWLSDAAASCATDATNASNIASGTLAAARLPASGVAAATYGDASHVAQVSVDATGRVTAASNVTISGGGNAALQSLTPQGRLTLTSATPVLTADKTAAPVIYYDCAPGKNVPYYDGTSDTGDAIASCEVSLTLKASGTGVENSGDLFDVWWAHGAAGLCVATNGSGGGWSSDAAGSLTARGTGYSSVHNTRGYWTNGATIAHCYNGTTDYGAIGADRATYLGTFTTTSAGQTGMQFLAAGAAGGSAPLMGLYNAYNRVHFCSLVTDTTSSWSETSGTWHATDSSTGNRVSWVDGLAQSPVTAEYEQTAYGNTGSGLAIGIDLDSTTGSPFTSSQMNGTGSVVPLVPTTTEAAFNAQIGLHYVQEVVVASAGTSGFAGLPAPGRQTQGMRLCLAM